MGKVKEEDEIFSYLKKEKLKEMADQIEEFINTVDKFLFLENVTEKEYKKAMKFARKCVKRLRKGKKLHKIFSKKKLEECIQNDPNFEREFMNSDFD